MWNYVVLPLHWTYVVFPLGHSIASATQNIPAIIIIIVKLKQYSQYSNAVRKHNIIITGLLTIFHNLSYDQQSSIILQLMLNNDK